jgi:MFS family permease
VSGGYRALFGRPSVRPLLAAISTAFLSFGMIGLALILTTHRATGSFGVAGLVMAAFSVGASVLAPARGRLIDRRGIRPWLIVFAGGYGASLALLVVLASGGSGTWPLVVCAACAGASAPPLISTSRGLWAATVEPALLRRAYALTSLIGDVGTVVAPALCGVLFVVAPWSPLLVCAASPLVGAAIVTHRFASLARSERSDDDARHLLSGSAMRALLVVSVALGAALGFVEVAVPASATRWGVESYTGLLLASFALGSVVGGLWFGRREWHRSAQERYLIAVGLLAIAYAPLLLATSPEALVPLLFIAGLSFGPATISLFEALDAAAPTGSTEALSWVTTAESAGIATGAVISGWMISTLGGRSPFAAASLILATAAIGALVWRVRGGNGSQSAER